MPAAGAKPCRIRCRKKKRDLDARRSERSTCSVVSRCNLPHHRSPAGVLREADSSLPAATLPERKGAEEKKRWFSLGKGREAAARWMGGGGARVCWAGPSWPGVARSSHSATGRLIDCVYFLVLEGNRPAMVGYVTRLDHELRRVQSHHELLAQAAQQPAYGP